MKKIIPFMAVAALAFSPLWAKERVGEGYVQKRLFVANGFRLLHAQH